MFIKQNVKFSGLSLVVSLATIFAFSSLISTIYTNTASALSITTSGRINIPLSASGHGANVAKDEVTINSSCSLGYTFSIKGPADNTLYKDGVKTTNATTKIAPSAGTKLAPTNINSNKNTWGISIDSNTTISTSTYFGLTSTAIDLFEKASASETDGDKYSIYYGASVDLSIEPGEYKLAESSTGAKDNVITYMLTANPACANRIQYDGNGHTSSFGMGEQDATGETTTLWAANYTKDDYGFAGWSTTQIDATDVTQIDQSNIGNYGKIYGPNETVPTNDVAGKTLYAVWIKPKNNATLQNWNGCSDLESGAMIALRDTRDGNVYTVAKLADDKCWMTENLRLGGADAIDLDSTETNITSNTFALSGSANPADWCNSVDPDCIERSMLYAGNVTSPDTTMTTGSANIYSYGNYYNWYTATAGNIVGDICPKGWHLPTGNTDGEFSALNSAMGETPSLWRMYPNNFVYSGYIRDNSLRDRGVGSVYWSSTTGGETGAYYLGIAPSLITPATIGINKNQGATVRCVISASSTYTISFNANGGSGTMSDQSVNTGETVTLNANAFTAPTGKAFIGWNTEANGSGTSYTDGQSVSNLTGNITLYAQWGCSGRYICYHGNGNTSAFGMGAQRITIANTVLWAANYAKEGYGFAGWSTTQVTADTTKIDSSNKSQYGEIYGPNQTIPTGDITDDGKTLYAVWVKSSADLQGWSGCPAMSSGDVIALKDVRDNNVYAIAKLDDDKCWMIENLRLGRFASGEQNVELTEFNTNSPSLPLNLDDGTTGNYLSGTSNSWCTISDSDCVNISKLRTDNTTNSVMNMTNADRNIYSYGNYYNWYSATAGNGTYEIESGDVTGSICPTDWHLPTGGSDGEFKKLNDEANQGITSGVANASLGMRSFPNNFILSGYTEGTSMGMRGYRGYFISSTAVDNSREAYWEFSPGDVNTPGTSMRVKKNGGTVRCVAD